MQNAVLKAVRGQVSRGAHLNLETSMELVDILGTPGAVTGNHEEVLRTLTQLRGVGGELQSQARDPLLAAIGRAVNEITNHWQATDNSAVVFDPGGAPIRIVGLWPRDKTAAGTSRSTGVADDHGAAFAQGHVPPDDRPVRYSPPLEN